MNNEPIILTQKPGHQQNQQNTDPVKIMHELREIKFELCEIKFEFRKMKMELR